MPRLRISIFVEDIADAKLYQALVMVPARRRATMIRALATNSLSFVDDHKTGRQDPVALAFAKAEDSLTVPHASAGGDRPIITKPKLGMTEKELSISKAIADSFD